MAIFQPCGLDWRGLVSDNLDGNSLDGGVLKGDDLDGGSLDCFVLNGPDLDGGGGTVGGDSWPGGFCHYEISWISFINFYLNP